MNDLAKRFDLGDDQFAILFETSKGIEADDLGTFLKRSATLARREGIELRVVRFEPGSLATIFKAVRKSTKNVRKAVKKEFMKAPIDTTLKATGIVGAVATAMIWAFTPEENGATPVAKAGACVVEEKEVTKITLITQYDTVLLMDEGIARQVRQIEREEKSQRLLPGQSYTLLADRARDGVLDGELLSVAGEPHFRPEGFRFLVPVDLNRSDVSPHLPTEVYVRVTGEIVMLNGRPDTIIVHSIRQL